MLQVPESAKERPAIDAGRENNAGSLCYVALTRFDRGSAAGDGRNEI
jgi:hypothetical protein